jgi:hypothetical protein
MDVTIKATIATDDERDVVCWKIADGVSDLLRSLDYDTGPRGITAKVTEPGSVVHLDVAQA